jgi:NitT/TauT family transport system substrate-binding protein
MKQNAIMILFFIATLFLATSAFCQKLRPVTIGLTGKSLATAAFEMSVRRGHFKKEGLDVKFITIRQSDVIIKAIMASELNFMSIIPTAILASVRGLPIRTIAVNLDNAPYVLVGRPQIKTMSDLKGKKVAVSSLGGDDTFPQGISRRAGRPSG